MQIAQYQDQTLNSMAPRDKRPKQNRQPGDGTIPAKLYQLFSRQLGTPLANSWIHRQYQYLCVDKISPFLASQDFVPRMNFDPVNLSASLTRKQLANDQVKSLTNCMQAV